MVKTAQTLPIPVEYRRGVKKKKPTESETTLAPPSLQPMEPSEPAPKEPEFKTLLERVVAITERDGVN